MRLEGTTHRQTRPSQERGETPTHDEKMKAIGQVVHLAQHIMGTYDDLSRDIATIYRTILTGFDDEKTRTTLRSNIEAAETHLRSATWHMNAALEGAPTEQAVVHSSQTLQPRMSSAAAKRKLTKAKCVWGRWVEYCPLTSADN